MTYLVLTRARPQQDKVAVNMDHVHTVEAAPKGGSRLYSNEGESAIYVEETFDQIVTLLKAVHA